MLRAIRMGVAGTCLTVLAACTGSEQPEEAHVAGGAATSTSASLDDADIALLVSHVNTAEISSGLSAGPKAQSAEVKAFASRMVAEHRAMNAALDSTEIRHDTLATPPPLFSTMQAASKAIAALLEEMPTGPAFDRTYVTAQVVNHAQALDSLRAWLGRVRDGRLKSSIEAAIARVQAHLDAARTLQGALGGGPAPGSAPPPAAPPARPDTSGGGAR